MIDDIITYREMCNIENSSFQRGMNYLINPNYSIFLMSRRANAPYHDKILKDWITIEYEGHDIPKSWNNDPKTHDQSRYTSKGSLTENGKFIKAIEGYKQGINEVQIVKIYEKIISWIWTLKWLFRLIDYKIKNNSQRNIYVFILELSETQDISSNSSIDLQHTRLIPSNVKQAVWKRDQWTCVLCWSKENLHFDHDLPFSKWWTSLTEKNIKLLCWKCNLSKSDKIQ